MTTLPQQQSTSMRLSRPAGGAVALPGVGGVAAHHPMQPTASSITMADVWRIVRANLWIAIVLLIVSGVCGYVLNRYLDKYYRSYTVTGLLQVQPSLNTNPLNASPLPVDQNIIGMEQRTQVRLMSSDALMSEVFQNSERQIRTTAWFSQYNGDTQRAKRDLSEDLTFFPIADSKLIAIQVTGKVPQDCVIIVNDFGDEHVRNQQESTQNEQLNRSARLSTLKGEYDKRLRDVLARLRDRQQQLNMDEFGTPGRLSIKEIRMQTFVNQQLELKMKGQALAAQLDAMTQQNLQGQVPAAIRQEVDKDPMIVNLEGQLMIYELNRPQGGAMNMRVRAADDQIATIREKLDTTRKQKLNEAILAVVDKLKADIAENAAGLKTINDEVDQLRDEIVKLNYSMAMYLTDKDEEGLLREQLKQVDNSIDMLRTTSGQRDQSTVVWAQRPQTPETPTFPNLKKTLAASLAIGLLLSAAIAFLREVMDTTVRSPRDIHRIGQMNFLGMIPHESDDPQAAGARLPLVIFDAPASMMADQLRQVRTRLQYAASLDTTRSILVTSPGPNDGKTVVACNLAAGLALNGRRILLVDADFRRPELHKTFQLDNTKGFADALQDVEIFEDCVKETQVPNLFVLTCGAKPSNSTELLESQLLVDFIERALQDFDHVIFDSGSLMVVSESIALAPRVDGVVTVVRARSNSRGLLGRMRDTLRQLKAEHLGVVLNAVRAQGGGYYGRNIKTYYAYQAES